MANDKKEDPKKSDLIKLIIGIILVNVPYVLGCVFTDVMSFSYQFKGFLDAMVFLVIVPQKEYSFLWGFIRGKGK